MGELVRQVSQGTGAGFTWIKEVVPIAVLVGAVWLLWPYLQGLISSWGGNNSGSSETAGFGSGTAPSTSTPSALQNIIKAISTPGTFINAGVLNTPQQGTGIGNSFVNTGPGTPNDLFPLGDVISTSQPLSTQEQQTVLTNLANQPYLGWWSTPAQNEAVVLATNPGVGINSGGSPQSNIPGGTKHCTCTDADRANGTCGPQDDWYVC